MDIEMKIENENINKSLNNSLNIEQMNISNEENFTKNKSFNDSYNHTDNSYGDNYSTANSNFESSKNKLKPNLTKEKKENINCGKNKYDIQDNKIETKTIEHSESSTNISQTNENNSSCENTTFSFLNNQEIKPNIENFFKKERNDEDIDTINFSKGFKSVSQICKNLNSKVYQLSQCNYYCNLIFSNLSYNNINKDLFLYNGFYNNYNQFCPNNQFYKYYTLKPFNFSYIKYDNSLYS